MSEKNNKKNKRSIILNAAMVAIVILIVILVLVLNGDIEVTLNTLANAKLNWVLCAFITWVAFTLLDAFFMQAFFIQQGIRIAFYNNIFVSLIGMFYSNVTPAATGGQPMQVLSLKRRGVNPGVSSSGVAIKFFCWQTALLFVGTVLWIANPSALDLTSKPIFFIILGYLLNGAAVTVVLLLVIRPKVVERLVELILKLGKKLHLVRNVEATRAKLENTIQEFNASVEMIKEHPFQLIRLILIEILQVIALMSITYCVYRAVGLDEVRYVDILTIQTLLYIAVSFFPLPGAAGAQEIGFSGFFKGIFGETTGAAMLLWRFFTYYIMIVLGLVGVLDDSVFAIRLRRKARNDASPVSSVRKGESVEKEGSHHPDA